MFKSAFENVPPDKNDSSEYLELKGPDKSGNTDAMEANNVKNLSQKRKGANNGKNLPDKKTKGDNSQNMANKSREANNSQKMLPKYTDSRNNQKMTKISRGQ